MNSIIETNFFRIMCLFLIVVIVILCLNNAKLGKIIKAQMKEPPVIQYDDFSGLARVGRYSKISEKKSLRAFLFQFVAVRYNYTHEILEQQIETSFKYTTNAYKNALIDRFHENNTVNEIVNAKQMQIFVIKDIIKEGIRDGKLIVTVLGQQTTAYPAKKGRMIKKEEAVRIQLTLLFNSNYKTNPFPYTVEKEKIEVITDDV